MDNQRGIALDPHGVLDVILRPSTVFPLDLIDSLRTQLDAAPASYQSRALAHRGENQQRRIGVVLSQTRQYPDTWIDALLDTVPVFRDQSLEQALDNAEELGDSLPGARILDRDLNASVWARLASIPDPEAITFAVRETEREWIEQQAQL